MPFDRDKFDREFDHAWKRQRKWMAALGVIGVAVTIGGLVFLGWLAVAVIDWLGRH